MVTQTTQSSATLCRERGWEPGRWITGTDEYGTTVLELTAIGEQKVLAVRVLEDGEAIECRREAVWDLLQREWNEV